MGKAKIREAVVFFEYWQKDLKKWMIGEFKARVYESDGARFKLFRVGVMAKVLGRTTHTLQEWERDKAFPKPIFQIHGSTFRWYSEDQIRMTSYMQRNILGDNPDRLRGPGLDFKGFVAAVTENWDVVGFDPNDYQTETIPTGKNDVIFEDHT